MENPYNIDDFIAGIELEDDQEDSAVEVHLTPSVADVLALNTPLNQGLTTSPWHPRLTFDIALGEEVSVLCDRYSITTTQLDDLYFVQAFRREVADHQLSIRENGITFKQKARVQAEMYLEVLDDIVNNVEVSPATRLDAIKSVVKWGELEPVKSDKSSDGGNQPQFNIQINL